MRKEGTRLGQASCTLIPTTTTHPNHAMGSSCAFSSTGLLNNVVRHVISKQQPATGAAAIRGSHQNF
eukprot:1304515-Amphidinium_carterae.2